MTQSTNAVRIRPRVWAYLVPVGAVIVALIIGAIILARLDANPIEAFQALLSGAFGSAEALISTAHRRRRPDGRRSVARDGNRAGAAGPAGRGHAAARVARRDRRRGDLGGDSRCAEGVLQRQRDPQHDHAQRCRRAADELPAARPDDRPGRDRARDPDSPDAAPYRGGGPPAAVRERPPPLGTVHRRPRGVRRLHPHVADPDRIPDPCRRVQPGRVAVCRSQGQAHDRAGDDAERRSLRPGRRRAGLREREPPDGHGRFDGRVHRQCRVQRDRGCALRRAACHLDDPRVVPVRRVAGRRDRVAASVFVVSSDRFRRRLLQRDRDLQNAEELDEAESSGTSPPADEAGEP